MKMPKKSYLGKDSLYNFMNSIVEESEYCTEVLEKHFNKKM